MEPAVAFGRALRRIRKQRGLTQEESGFEADLRRTFVSVLKLGQRQPTLTTIVKLSRVFGMLPSELMKEVESEF
jgi:transcriptional regulator with XRE-family HTH domain